eukprot:gb/GEZN01001776.1/.p1 GENE.gb/GEZN01001776.1/~~gb/GEZN01001776.1/.p1  ORF type:complete len:746 (-),score=69.50 gb/GEZN01001776.1/:450-2687(-)
MSSTISVPLHGHPLTLVAHVYNGTFVCNSCRAYGQGWVYHCALCKFDLHLYCGQRAAAVKIQAVARGRQVRKQAAPQHTASPAATGLDPRHQHPLDYQTQVYQGKYVCNGCRRPGTGPVYHCTACNFDLHPHCFLKAEATQARPAVTPTEPNAEVKRPAPPPMEAPPPREYKAAVKIQTAYRGHAVRQQTELKQITKPLKEEANKTDPRHPHQLTYKTSVNKGKYICNGCRQMGSGPVYQCMPCSWDLHPHCVGKASDSAVVETNQGVRAMEFRTIRVHQSNPEWKTLPLKDWDMVPVLVGPGSTDVAIASWRWDVGSDAEVSPNLIKVLEKAALYPNLNYVLADVISLDQTSADIMDKVVQFSDLYFHLQSVTSYGADPKQASDRSRCWIANETTRMIYSRTPIKELCTDSILSSSWELTLSGILEQVGAIADAKSPWAPSLAILISFIPNREQNLSRVMEMRLEEIFSPSSRQYLVGMLQSPFVTISAKGATYLSDMLCVYTLWLYGEKGSKNPEVRAMIGTFQQIRGDGKFVIGSLVLLLSLTAKYMENGCMNDFKLTPDEWVHFLELLFTQAPSNGRKAFEYTVTKVPKGEESKSRRQRIGWDPADARRFTNDKAQAEINCENNYQFLRKQGVAEEVYVETTITGFCSEGELIAAQNMSAKEQDREMIARIIAGGSQQRPSYYSTTMSVFFAPNKVIACSTLRQGRSIGSIQALGGMLLQQVALLVNLGKAGKLKLELSSL